jgi:protein gp37
VRFVSAEPLLGPIDFTHIKYAPLQGGNAIDLNSLAMNDGFQHNVISWVISGGESGRGARPFDTAWASSIVKQCQDATVPCFVKQLGAHVIQQGQRQIKRDKKGGDMSEWPHELRVRQMPEVK